MNTLKIVNVVGCRSSFVRISPLLAQLSRRRGMLPLLVYTGKSTDLAALASFFRDTKSPEPNLLLNVGSGSDARQTALVMENFEGILFDVKPDLVLVMGDMNSTLACTVTAVKLGIPVGHVDAGVRSFDREMPEEINRVVIDALSDLLFTSGRDAARNLQSEGVPQHRIYNVGNLLVDTLLMNSDAIAHSEVLRSLGLGPRTYAMVSLRTGSNAFGAHAMTRLAAALERVQAGVRLVFPTPSALLSGHGDLPGWRRIRQLPNVHMIEPLAYVDFVKLLRESLFVLTDSPNVEEESTALGVPCLGLGNSTERPVTVSQGTNRLVGTNIAKIVSEAAALVNGTVVRGRLPERWEGAAAQRIAGILARRQGAIRRMHKRVRARSICPDISSAA